jgi:hypothetical protein
VFLKAVEVDMLAVVTIGGTRAAIILAGGFGRGVNVVLLCCCILIDVVAAVRVLLRGGRSA